MTEAEIKENNNHQFAKKERGYIKRYCVHRNYEKRREKV